MDDDELKKVCYKFLYENNQDGASLMDLYKYLVNDCKIEVVNELNENVLFRYFNITLYEKENLHLFENVDILFYNEKLVNIFCSLSSFKDSKRYLIDIKTRLSNVVSDGIVSFSTFFNSYMSYIALKCKLINVIQLNDSLHLSISDKDIYIQSLQYFYDNWKVGVSVIDYKHHVLNILNVNLSSNTLDNLYVQIVNPIGNILPNDLNVPKLASMQSILGLLEYQELQHSLEESKEAKKEAIIANNHAIDANKKARDSIRISIIALVVSIIFSILQMCQSQHQFDKEQEKEQYNKKPLSTKKSIEYKPINNVFVNKK